MEKISAGGITPGGSGAIVDTSLGVQPKPIRGSLAANGNVRFENISRRCTVWNRPDGAISSVARPEKVGIRLLAQGATWQCVLLLLPS